VSDAAFWFLSGIGGGAANEGEGAANEGDAAFRYFLGMPDMY
jgi:hypothetical protein